MNEMENRFMNNIKDVNELTVDVEEGCVGGATVCFDGLTLITFKDVSEAKNHLTEIMDFYNNELWHDESILMLMVCYFSHINKYNHEGWKNRFDFPTPETYRAFITGFEISIRKCIEAAFVHKFTPTSNTTINTDDVYNYIMSKM